MISTDQLNYFTKSLSLSFILVIFILFIPDDFVVIENLLRYAIIISIIIGLYIVLDLFKEETTVDLHSLETKVNSPGLLFCMNKVGMVNKMQEISDNIFDVVYKNDAGIITISGLDKLDKNKILSEYYAA